MKLLLDGIFTNDPQYDVMQYKLRILAEDLLEENPDLYIYWVVPSDLGDGRELWDIDWGWYPKHPRINYYPVPTYRDRLKEYYRIDPKLRELLWFCGHYYDVDIVITCRIPMVPAMQVIRGSIRAPRPWSKKIYTVDDMPITSAKKHLGKQHEFAQDVMQLSGYLVADANYFMSFWIKDVVLGVGRNIFSPSQMRELMGKSYDTNPIYVKMLDEEVTGPGQFKLQLKTPEAVQATVARDKPFTIGFTQRFEVNHRGCVKVMDLFTRQWVYRGGAHKMRFVVTSNSRGAKRFVDTEFMEVYRAPRDEFWEMMRTQMDVTIVMTIEDEYSLSLLEPIMLGVPGVVLRKRYSEGTLTKDYPFFVNNETEAYGMVKAFFDDYAGMYDKFAEWFTQSFVPELKRRNGWYWPPLMQGRISRFREECQEKLNKSNKNNEIVDLLLAEGGDEFIIREKLKELVDGGHLRSLQGQLSDREIEHDSISFTNNWNEYRLRLQYHHGFVDAGFEAGHLRRG